MDDVAVKCFLEAAKYGSFSAAASELYLTRQAISRQILKLEKEIGHSLFERGHGALKLTYAGELCREFFLESQSRWRQVMDEISLTEQPDIPHIRISCINGIDVWRLLNQSIQTVQKQYSFEVDITYHSPEILFEELNRGNQDLFITFRPWDEHQVPERYFWKTISPVNMCLAVGTEHPLCARATTAFDFADEPMVTWLRMHDTEESCIRKCLRDCRGMGLSPKNVLVFPNMESAHAAIEFCKGVGLCSTVSKLVSSPAIRCFPLREGADLVCLFDRSTLPPAALALLNALDMKEQS